MMKSKIWMEAGEIIWDWYNGWKCDMDRTEMRLSTMDEYKKWKKSRIIENVWVKDRQKSNESVKIEKDYLD